MRSKNFFTTGIILLLFVFLSGCSTKDKTTTSSRLAEEEQKKEVQKVNPPPDQKLTGKYELKKFEKTYNNCKAGSDSCTYITIAYQILNEGPQSLKINKAITDSITKYSFTYEKPLSTIDQSMESFIKEFDEYKKDMKSSGNDDYMINWYFEEKGAVEFDNSNILSYSTLTNSFTGGAHGSNYISYYIFDQTTGMPLTYKDVFEKGSEKDLNKLIEKKFRQVRGLKPQDNLVEAGGLFENHIEHNDNFAIFKDGIKFYYNSYEIAPYSSGPIELIFSWGELGNLINNNLKINK
ncbi:hypothetical protein BH10BAC5_BH10BAC5_08920 [soil metagenome]